jgi:hypothetical protein
VKSSFYAQALLNARRGVAFVYPTVMYYAASTCTKGARSNSTPYALGDTMVVVPTGKTQLQLYGCTFPGVSAASSPAFAGSYGESIPDGNAVWMEMSPYLMAGTNIGEPTIGLNNYARVPFASNTSNWNAATGQSGRSAGAITTSAPIIFNAAIVTGWAGWVWALASYDALAGGNLWELESLSSPVVVGNGIQLTVPGTAFGVQEG